VFNVILDGFSVLSPAICLEKHWMYRC